MDTIDVSLHLDHDDPAGVGQGQDVEDASVCDAGLSVDAEQRFDGKGFEKWGNSRPDAIAIRRSEDISRTIRSKSLLALPKFMNGKEMDVHQGSPLAASSNVDHVLQYLRDGIIEGRFPSCSKLLPNQIAASCGTSFIPVREALRALEAEGFVNFVHNRGAFVASLSIDDLESIYEFRIDLECEAVRRAAPFTSANNAYLADLLTRSTAAHDQNDKLSQLALNRDFHFFIYERANSPRRLKVINELWLHSARYQRMSIDHRGDAGSEHHEIAENLSSGDHVGAANALKNHLQNTIDLIRSEIISKPAQPDEANFAIL